MAFWNQAQLTFALQGHFEEAVSCSYETVLLGHRSGQSQLIATSTVNVGKVGQRYVEMLAEVVARLVKDGHGRPAAKVIHDFHACPALLCPALPCPTLRYPALPCIQNSFQFCPASMTFMPAPPCPALLCPVYRTCCKPVLPCPVFVCTIYMPCPCFLLPCPVLTCPALDVQLSSSLPCPAVTANNGPSCI